MGEYPKWVKRAPHIGAVLCLNAGEEKKLLDDWEAEQLAKAEAEAAEAEKAAKAAEEAAKLQLKTQAQAPKK